MSEVVAGPNYNKSVGERVMISARSPEDEYDRVRKCRLYTEPGQVILNREIPDGGGLYRHNTSRAFIATTDGMLMITCGRLVDLTRSVEAGEPVLWKIATEDKGTFTISIGELNTFYLGGAREWKVEAEVEAVFVDIQDFGEAVRSSGWYLSAQQDPVPEFLRDFEQLLNNMPLDKQLKIRRALTPGIPTKTPTVANSQYL